MKDNELDDLLREKANNIDDSKFNFKMDVNEIKKQAEAKKKNNILRISFASALAACLVLGALFFILKYQSPKEDNITIQGNDKNNQDEIAKNHSIVDTIVCEKETIAWIDKQRIFTGVISISEIQQNEIVNDVPNTVVVADILDKLYENKKFSYLFDEDIDFYISSCKCTYEDMPENVKTIVENTVETIDNENYYQIVSNEKMKLVPYPEVGKQYIVTLAVENDKLEVVESSKYSFYEYDPETKKVKIGEEWQDIDFNYIVW